MVEQAEHWNTVWSDKDPTTVSWFQPTPTVSLRLIADYGPSPLCSIVDIGSGASRLVTELIAAGVPDIEVLDIAAPALSAAAEQAGYPTNVTWTIADVAAHRFDRTFDVWHDRAAFHFLNEIEQRAGYLDALRSAVAIGGIAIIATFADDGPESCSGLPVSRYSAAELAAEFPGFELLHEEREDHVKPDGEPQKFQYVVLRRSV